MNLRSAAFLAVLASLAACSVSMADSGRSDPPLPTEGFDASAGAASESATTSGLNQWGSALCGARFGCEPDETSGCSPDAGLAADYKGDAASPTPSLVDAGAAPPSDASVPYDGGAGSPKNDGPYACRVTRRSSAGGAVAAQCVTAGTGKDGEACRASSDCGPGFECVGSPGQCRRYCCSSACGAERVCDKQLVVGNESLTVPVCMPIHPCKLLSPCPNNETCGIADQIDGRTSCLAVGAAQAGESCEQQNCAGDLTCLGEVGARLCYKLCSKSHPSCPEGSRCKGTLPLFQDPDQGVCLKDL